MNQHAPYGQIDPAAAHPFGFPQHAFTREAQPLRNGAALMVSCAAVNHDAMQLQIEEGLSAENDRYSMTLISLASLCFW